MRLTARIFIFLTLPCAVGVAGAQPSADSVVRVDAVSVTGHRVARDVIPAQVLSGEELQRLGTVSVADAIRYFSGAQIKDYGGIGGLKTVNVRSLGSQHVGVFYDGVQLGNAQNGTVDLGRFSMDNMEAISLHNGQKSNIFQSAKDFASASAIYLATRRPVFDGTRRDNLRLGLRGGSFGTINPSALWERRFSERLDTQLSAEYMSTTGRYRFRTSKQNGYDTTEVRRNGDVRALRVEGGVFGRLARGDWRAKLYYYDSERGYPGAVVRGEPGKYEHEDRQWDRNFFVQSSLRQHFGRYSLMLNAKYAHDRLHYIADPRSFSADNRFLQQEAYVSAANELALSGRWRVALSGDLQYNTLDADFAPDPANSFGYPSRRTALAVAATELDLDRFKLQGSLLHTYVDNKTRVAGAPARDRNEWTPTAVAMYRPFGHIDLSVRAFYKRIFRMPTLNDIYYTFNGSTYSDLRPEYTTQYNMGAVWGRDLTGGLLRRIEVQADAYFNRVTDKIVAMPVSNQVRWTMDNIGRVEIRGVDAAVQGAMRFGGVDLHTRLNYTYQKAQDLTDKSDNYYGSQIPYIPWHSGSAVVSAAWGGWDLNYSFIYTGERYEAGDNDAGNYVAPWYTHDMSLSRTLGRLRITAEVNNIFDRQYEVVQRYPMPGTNFRIKINWTL